MGLKAFHIFFITLSTLLALAFGFWGVDDFGRSGSWFHLTLGVASFVASGGLVWYGVWFLRKLKHVGYL